MDHSEFFAKFPWVSQLPAAPHCDECRIQMTYTSNTVALSDTEDEVSLYMSEDHALTCSRARLLANPRPGEIRSKAEMVLVERKIVSRQPVGTP